MNDLTTINDLYNFSHKIKINYDKLNLKNENKVWSYIEFAQGMAGDVEDLAKLLMAKNRFRKLGNINIDSAIEHKLCDVLWSVLIISKELNIDLANSFPKFAIDLNTKLIKMLSL